MTYQLRNVHRTYIDRPPVRDQDLADKFAPDDDNTANHLARIESASRGWGFPVAPCARQWPPKAAARGQRMVWP